MQFFTVCFPRKMMRTDMEVKTQRNISLIYNLMVEKYMQF
jgi:hypothetical protein